MSNIEADKQLLYWKEQVNILDAEESRKQEMEEAVEKARTEAHAEGKLKGEIKGEISKVKTLVKHQIPQESFISDLKLLTHDRLNNPQL